MCVYFFDARYEKLHLHEIPASNFQGTVGFSDRDVYSSTTVQPPSTINVVTGKMYCYGAYVNYTLVTTVPRCGLGKPLTYIPVIASRLPPRKGRKRR